MADSAAGQKPKMNCLQLIFRTRPGIGGAYLGMLVIFAIAYYFMPEDDFYHQTIQFEPATVQHREQFENAINSAFELDKFDITPQHLTVSSNKANNFIYRSDSISVDLEYYYYRFARTAEEWSAIEATCGPSEKESTFYKRSMNVTITTFASVSRTSITVRAKSQRPITECEFEILGLLYKSVEKTDHGFQAMLDTSSNTQDLLLAVSHEQLGNALREFWFDRATRMLYFSTAAITTTGFGDILPMTPRARLVTALESLLGIVFAGLFINAISSTNE
jgi:hypothetical protein